MPAPRRGPAGRTGVGPIGASNRAAVMSHADNSLNITGTSISGSPGSPQAAKRLPTRSVSAPVNARSNLNLRWLCGFPLHAIAEPIMHV